MKLYDNETQDLAQAVQAVLEGKTPVKEAKYPHDMFHPETGEKVVANNEEEHNALSKKGYTHEAPKENVAGPADLDNKENQKKVKAAHPVDVKEDIDVAHEEALEMNESLEEKKLIIYKQAKLKDVTSKLVKGTLSFKAPTRVIFVNKKGEEVPVSIDEETNEGILDKKPLIPKAPKKKKGLVVYKPMKHKALIGKLAKGQLSIMVPQPGIMFVNKKGEELPLVISEETVAEAKADEQSDKQKKYKAFFDKALKKFGVDSPAELEGDKKKEFFDYVDANYEAENEED